MDHRSARTATGRSAGGRSPGPLAALVLPETASVVEVEPVDDADDLGDRDRRRLQRHAYALHEIGVDRAGADHGDHDACAGFSSKARFSISMCAAALLLRYQ